MFFTSSLTELTTKCFLQYCGKRTMSEFTPRRAFMYVPASDERKVNKAETIGADLIVLDCEDGVAVNKKECARKKIAELLNTAPFPLSHPQWGVRVNSVSSELCQSDLHTILDATNKPPCIVLPKVESVEEIKWFTDVVETLNPGKAQMDLIICSETAGGLVNLAEITKSTIELGKKACLNLVALLMGSDDYIANIGATRTKSCLEVLYARQRLLMIAKAFNLQAIDMVHIDIQDLDELRRTSVESATWGFTGRQVIHPTHVPIVQEAYSPSHSQIAWASELVKAFDIHQQMGKGAFVFRDQMIDMPTLRQARNVVNYAKKSRKAGS